MKITFLFLALTISVLFGESNIISVKGLDDEIYKIGQNLLDERCERKNCVQPSFDCRGKLSEVEGIICDSAEVDSVSVYAVLPFYDNLFNSLYVLILRNIATNEKIKPKAIARKLVKSNKESNSYESCADMPSRGAMDLCIVDSIVANYWLALRDLNAYIIKNNPNIFATIFSKHTTEYKRFFLDKYTPPQYENEYFFAMRLFGALYNDGLIDKNGAIVGDSHNDSRESKKY